MILKIFSILYFLFQTSIAQSAVIENKSNIAPWKILNEWQKNHEDNSLKIIMQTEIKSLNCESGKSLEFPTIMHSRQEIELDGNLIATNGSDNYIRSIYGAPIIDCNLLQKGSLINWKVTAFVESFANLNHLPKIKDSDIINKTDIYHLISFGANFIVALFLIISTFGTTFFRQAIFISFFSICMGLFLMFSIFGLLGYKVHYLLVDKLACLSIVGIGYSLVSFLSIRNLTSYKITVLTKFILFSSIPIFFFSNNGNHLQIILNIIFLPLMINVWFAVFSILKALKSTFNIKDIISFIALLSFALSATSDVLFTYGIHHWGMTIGFGFTGTSLFFAFLLQTEIYEMNRERDYLKTNLQNEVSIKTNSLEKALSELKSTQADLVQSSRLASLGTLSAGIAHEINNSINYVSGALVPLEKMVMKFVPDNDIEKIKKLFNAIKAGTELTVSIVKSLRTYTGLNQSPVKDVNLNEVTQSVLTILRSKLKDIQVENKVNAELTILGNQVGLSQILMNLITNAIDAVKAQDGKIIIEATTDQSEAINICVSDNGTGIPHEIQEKIFDPFYTTKDVGKGTGLGLYIVKNEVNKIGGKIKIETEQNKGTKFIINLPRKVESQFISKNDKMEAS